MLFFIMIVYSCPRLLVMGVKMKSSSQEECQSNGTSVSALGEKKKQNLEKTKLLR